MASVDCSMDSWEADLFPASLASMYLSACSSVMAWLGSPRRSIWISGSAIPWHNTSVSMASVYDTDYTRDIPLCICRLRLVHVVWQRTHESVHPGPVSCGGVPPSRP